MFPTEFGSNAKVNNFTVLCSNIYSIPEFGRKVKKTKGKEKCITRLKVVRLDMPGNFPKIWETM